MSNDVKNSTGIEMINAWSNNNLTTFLNVTWCYTNISIALFAYIFQLRDIAILAVGILGSTFSFGRVWCSRRVSPIFPRAKMLIFIHTVAIKLDVLFSTILSKYVIYDQFVATVT